MIKKIFPVLLIVIIVIIFSNYQKNNQTIKKMLNSKNAVTIQPTDLIKKTVNKSEKIFLQVDEPKNNITVNNPIINISGKTIANGYIFINEQELKADVNGVFASATTLDEGENYILIVASDDLGNSVEKDILVNLESTQ
ncbi:MAG: hypothetical protein AAB788_02645 [Patescibacteria group bacterium]